MACTVYPSRAKLSSIVIKITGMDESRLLRRLAVSMPLMPSMRVSKNTASNFPGQKSARNSSPLRYK
jgi:hypothetical protein